MVMFSGDIYTDLGYTNNQVVYLIIASRVLALFSSSALSFMVEKFRKKKILMLIGFLLGVCQVLVVCLYYFDLPNGTNGSYEANQTNPKITKYATTIILNIILSLCFMGPLTIPVVITTMMIRPQYRTIVNNLIEFISWLGTFFITLIFPTVYQIFGNGIFGLFTVFMGLNIVWMKFRFIGPEGKGYGEIEGLVERRRFYL